MGGGRREGWGGFKRQRLPHLKYLRIQMREGKERLKGRKDEEKIVSP